MGCLIKIRTNDGYLFFNNRESAEAFISKKLKSGELSFSKFEDEFKDPKGGELPKEFGQEIVEIQKKGKNSIPLRILDFAKNRSFALTKAVQDKMHSEELHAKGTWDTEEFNSHSNIIGVGKLLQQLRLDGDKRLFPEFISKNYQNTLIIKEVLRYTNLYKNDDNSLEKQCSEIAEFLEFSTEDRVLSSEEWVSKISAAIKNEDAELFRILQMFDARAHSTIMGAVNNTLKANILQLFKGEIFHKIFEKHHDSVPKNYNSAYKHIIDNLKTRYADCEEIKQAFGSANSCFDTVTSLFMTPNAAGKTLFDKYCYVANQIYTDVVSHFKEVFPGASIKPCFEVPITLKIDDNNIKQTCFGNKDFVQGKLDLVILVNGVAHIVDLKTIKSANALDVDGVKFAKTKYTMGMYKRMIERLGITVGGLYIYDAVTTEDDIAQGRLSNISNRVAESTIQSRLDGVMKRITYSRSDIRVISHQYDDRVNELFGEQISKSKQGFDLEDLKRQITIREGRDGEKILSYKMLNDKGREETKTKLLTENTDVDSEKQLVAEQMLQNREKYAVSRFNYIKNSLKDIISGATDISALYAYDSSEYDARYWATTVAKYKNAKGVIEVEGLDELGIILVETDSGVDVLHVTTANIYDTWDSNNSNKKLFDHIGIKSNLNCSIGNVLLIKAALVANDIIKNLDIENKNINTVKVLQTDSRKNWYLPNKLLQQNMETVCSHLKIEDYFQHNMSDPFITALCDISTFYASTENTGKQVKKLVKYNKSSKQLSVGSESITIESFANIADEIHSVIDQSFTLSKAAKIAFLQEVESALLKNYSSDFSSDPTKVPLSLQEVHLLKGTINRALNSLLDKETMIDRDVSKYGINNGVAFNSIDMVGVKSASDIRTLVEQGNTKITKRYNKYQSQMRAQVSNYHNWVGYSGAKKYLGGRTAEIYARLFRRDPNNSKEFLNNDLILKNPWDPKEHLSKEESDFIKFVLFTLNKYKYGWKSMDQMTESRLAEVDYLFPLCRIQNKLDKIIDANGEFKMPSWRALVEDSINKVNDLTHNSANTYDAQYGAANTLSEVYNEYASRTDKTVRSELISTYGLDSFMVDIHTALNMFVVAMESADVYNNEVLPAVKSILYVATLDEVESGIPIENTKEFIKSYLTSAIYSAPIYKGEVKEYMRIAAPLLGAASSLALSWNLVNLPRERIMGMFSIISRAAFASYGQNTFGIKNYLKAWAIMGWDMKDFVHTITKVELLNEHFRISNMTINELPQETSSSRTGLWQTFNRWMGWTLVAPDYWNRMTMFVAQMLEDGCWDAYSVVETENGVELKYDMSKDSRFELLCRYGDKIEQVPEKFRNQYLQQQALYEIKRDEINESADVEEQITHPISSTNTDWYLNTAYTTKERNSLKSFSDSTFGYYDRDTKAWLYKTAVGVLFKQFMAYASSKKVQYFKTGTDQTDRGEYAQLTTNGGERIWKILVPGEQGKTIPLNVKESELNDKYSEYKNTAKPVYIWKGTFVEGIVNSYWNLLTETVKAGKLYFFDNDLESKQKAKEIVKTLKEQYGKRGNIRHSNLLQGLYDLWISIGLMWLLRLLIFDDPATTGESYETQLKNSDPLFKFSYSVLLQATSDFNIATLLYNQAFEWRMPALSIFQNTAKSFWRALGDEDLTWYEGLGKGVISSAGIFKPIRPFADTYFEETKQN